MFVRAGSFIPQYMRQIENVSQYNPQFLTVRYYPSSKETEYTLYDDNRMSPTSLADGAYQLTYFTGEKRGDKINISLRSNGGKYEGMPSLRMVTLEIIDVARPVSVELSDGSPMPEAVSVKAIRQYGWAYDAVTRTLSVRFPWTYAPLGVSVN